MVTCKYWKIVTLAVLLVFVIFALVKTLCKNGYDDIGHPDPLKERVFEAIDPETNKPIIRIVTTEWTDDNIFNAYILFKQTDNTIWHVIFADNRSDLWSEGTVLQLQDTDTELTLENIVTLRKLATVFPGEITLDTWSDIDKLKNSLESESKAVD